MMRKIPFNIKYFYLIFLTTSVFTGFYPAAQELSVTTSVKDYQATIKSDSLQQMVELKSAVPLVMYDLRYATRNNFTGVKFYKSGSKTFLRKAAGDSLQQVQLELLAAGYSLKIWDAYRPYAVTKKMWELIGDERYVANPARGSNHNRGLAVDVTLYDVVARQDVNMGTEFDAFTDTAHHSFTGLPESILVCRALLKSTMEKYGFKSFDTEWWHYSFANDRNYAVLDLSFDKLPATTKKARK